MLWTWVRLNVRKVNIRYMATLLCMLKPCGLIKVVIQCMTEMEKKEVSEKLIQALVNHPGLKELDDSADLNSVDPELLALAVTKLEVVEFKAQDLSRFKCLSTNYISAICSAMRKNSMLKRLNLPKSTYLR